MNLNSRLFDSIRVKPAAAKDQVAPAQMRCDRPGCLKLGEFRAPMGRDREGQYFCFCLDHVREYNATYNYFNGMSDADVAKYQKDSLTGHRPTWAPAPGTGSMTTPPRSAWSAAGRAGAPRRRPGRPATALPP